MEMEETLEINCEVGRAGDDEKVVMVGSIDFTSVWDGGSHNGLWLLPQYRVGNKSIDSNSYSVLTMRNSKQ